MKKDEKVGKKKQKERKTSQNTYKNMRRKYLERKVMKRDKKMGKKKQ